MNETFLFLLVVMIFIDASPGKSFPRNVICIWS